jgi:hypothetical protein
LDYTQSDSDLGGSRFYLSYSGSAPTPANCVTLAGDIGTAWASNLANLICTDYNLTEVDVLDLGSHVGASGQDNTTHNATGGTPILPANCALNVEYNIARRYRGGKPRMYLPPAPQSELQDPGHWLPAYLTTVNTHVAAFFAALEALTIGSMGTLQHVSISFYQGVYTTTPPWRGPGFKYPPKYRDTPLIDVVEGYACKSVVGSQRRRRTATTF